MERNKHDHKATKKIKAWLFGIMLLLPFLFMLPTGLYYGLNQNAQLSERTEQQPVYYESNEVNTADDILVGNIYYWTDNIIDLSPLLNKDFGYVEPLEEYKLYNPNFNLNDNIRFFAGGATLVLQQNSEIIILVNRTLNIVFTTINQNRISLISDYLTYSNARYIKEYHEVTTTQDISTSIINAWNSTWQNPLFSWTNNTFITSTINNFTSGFGITAETYISNLITYIAILTAIYIIFDIVIELFTKLTHIIPRSD